MTSGSPTGEVWTERWWYALGSEAHCQIEGGPAGLADAVIDEAEALESCWSRFRPTSDLVRLNLDRSETVRVSGPLAAAIHRAKIAWELTDGWFDATVIDSMETAGYDSSFTPDRGPRGDLEACRRAPGMAEVTVDLDRCLVHRPPGVRFDLGGLGKGLAADILATTLVSRGARRVCVALGGDIRVAGEAPSEGWRILVEDPMDAGSDVHGRIWFEVVLGGGAVVTSTTLFRRWMTRSGEMAHHLIDPRTGRPSCSSTFAVVVTAAEAWWAESLAKAALLAGPLEGAELLARHGATAWFRDEGEMCGLGLAAMAS